MVIARAQREYLKRQLPRRAGRRSFRARRKTAWTAPSKLSVVIQLLSGAKIIRDHRSGTWLRSASVQLITISIGVGGPGTGLTISTRPSGATSYDGGCVPIAVRASNSLAAGV